MRLALSLLVLAVACGPVKPPPVVPDPPEPMMPAPVEEGPTPIEGLEKLVDLNPDPDVVEVNLEARQAMITIGGRTVPMYTFNGSFPGPLLEAKAKDRVIVHFTNALPEATTIHWHGLRISDQMDGNPRIQTPVQPGGTFTYDFVAPEAGSFWYHPHVRANEQVEKGLYGPIIIRSPKDPRYDRERYLVLDDILLKSNGQFEPFMAAHMEAMMGRYGNVMLTNGKEDRGGAGYTGGAVQIGTIERWRIVNTANARTMYLKLTGAYFQVISTDGGLLPQPWGTTEAIELAVGQRIDLEVRYAEAGLVTLDSLVLADDGTGKAIEVPIQVFNVAVGTPALDNVRNPALPVVAPPSRVATRTVQLDLDAMNDPVMGLMWLINGKAHSTEPVFTATNGETLRVRIVNHVGMEHPFHLHGQFFSVVDHPEQGLRDVVLIPGNATVLLDAYLDNPGRWMAHCHILEHAELGMMSEFVVSP